jgi:hypothetical protein
VASKPFSYSKSYIIPYTSIKIKEYYYVDNLRGVVKLEKIHNSKTAKVGKFVVSEGKPAIERQMAWLSGLYKRAALKMAATGYQASVTMSCGPE